MEIHLEFLRQSMQCRVAIFVGKIPVFLFQKKKIRKSKMINGRYKRYKIEFQLEKGSQEALVSITSIQLILSKKGAEKGQR